MPGIDGPYNATGSADFVLPALRDIVNVVWRVNVLPDLARATPDPLMDRLYQVGWWSIGLDLGFLGLFPVFIIPRFVEVANGTEFILSRPGSAYDTLRVNIGSGGDVDFWAIYA